MLGEFLEHWLAGTNFCAVESDRLRRGGVSPADTLICDQATTPRMTPSRLLLTLILTLTPALAWGQGLGPQPEPKRLGRGDNEVFRWLLHRHGLKPLTNNELSEARWRSSSELVVIVFGSWNNSFPGGQHLPQWITGVMGNGGAVLVASDQASTLSPGSGLPPILFNTRRVVTPQPIGEWLVLNRNPIESFMVPFDAPPGGGNEWKLFGGEEPLRRVVTELPASITVQKGGPITPLAGYPWNSVFQGTLTPIPPDHVFAVGASRKAAWSDRHFSFLALADQAVFLNGQMVARDENEVPTDNLEFADRTVRYLTDSGNGGKRTKCLFIENGKVVGDYDRLTQLLRPPLPPLPKPDWGKLQPKLVDFGNQILNQVQEKDIPNQLVVGKNPEAPRSWFRAFVGFLLTIAGIWAALALMRRVWGARGPTDVAGAPPGGRPPPPPDGAAGVFGRRGKELATRDNLLEPARAACRDLFDLVGRPPEPGPRLPKVTITDEVRKPETLRQALRELWAVAYGRPTPVTAIQWAALEPLLKRALTAHRDRKWRFVEADAWPDVSTRPRGEA